MADEPTTPLMVADRAPIDGAPTPLMIAVEAPTDEVPTSHPDDAVTSTPSLPRKPKMPPRPDFNKLYALPAPLRTFPLPTLIPHNPISLFHILYVWLSQKINPPSSQLDQPYQGWWSPDTRSVHVTDSRSIRGLWEQGFYGKGILSRSEPDWMHKESTRRGIKSKVTSEDIVQKRREQRQQTKWERARLQREAIDQQLLKEADNGLLDDHINVDLTSTDEDLLADSDTSTSLSDIEQPLTRLVPNVFFSPVGPLELLSLPNSALDFGDTKLNYLVYPAPVGPQQILAMPNSLPLPSKGSPLTRHNNLELDRDSTAEFNSVSDTNMNGNGAANGIGIDGHTSASFVDASFDTSDDTADGSVHSDESTQASSVTPNGSVLTNGNHCSGMARTKRQKSVRFSPTVEKNTFIQSEPPSPERAMAIAKEVKVEEEPFLQDQEHLQLTMEEAFFLSYSLGSLSVLDPATNEAISNEKLFDLFRKSSHFPPLAKPMLSPDDSFMLNYVVYHHYRSLGWCVRGGAKFSVDFMLYNRGPVFSHAEFALIILPSYSDDYWSSDAFLQNYVKGKERRTWAWMHCINRVIAHAKKTLVLVYVDIPKPLETDAVKAIGVDGMLKRYQVREFVMKRWQVNRARG